MTKKLNKSIKSRISGRFSKSASSKSGKVHIIQSKDGWSVKREGAKRSSVVKNSQDSAIKAAKKLRSIDRVVIHKKDGTIRSNIKKRK